MNLRKCLSIVVFFGLMGALSSCGNKLEKEVKTQQDELMRLHDEVMPASMNIDKLKSDLQITSKLNEGNDSLKILIIDTSMKLQKANDEMYLWMKDFGTAMNETEELELKAKLYKELLPEIERIKEETEKYSTLAKQIADENR